MNEVHVSKLNWRQISPCKYIQEYPIYIVIFTFVFIYFILRNADLRHKLSSKWLNLSKIKVDELYDVVWESGRRVGGKHSLQEIREHVQHSLRTLRPDHRRSLNPTPYKVT